jgi:hypothetical protein
MTNRDFPQCDPFAALAGALLNRAKLDALRGDLSAPAWLICDGATLAARLHPDGDDLVLAFCRQALAAVDAEQVRVVWGV